MENNYFNQENTNGYTDSDITIMNKRLAEYMADYDPESDDYNDIMKNASEKIQHEFDIENPIE